MDEKIKAHELAKFRGQRSQMALLSVNVRSPKRMPNTMGQTRT